MGLWAYALEGKHSSAPREPFREALQIAGLVESAAARPERRHLVRIQHAVAHTSRIRIRAIGHAGAATYEEEAEQQATKCMSHVSIPLRRRPPRQGVLKALRVARRVERAAAARRVTPRLIGGED